MGRGRRSLAELALVGPAGARPEPPGDLGEAEAAHWREIVGRLPPSYFPRECQPLLKCLVRHIHHGDLLAADIAELRRAPPPVDVKALHAAMRLHILESERIANLSTKLRLSKQSRLDRESAEIEARKTPLGTKPWEGWDQTN